MDLVLMVVNNKEPIILLTYFEIESTVMGFHVVHRNNWDPSFIGEVLKTCMELRNKVNKYAVAVVDNENNVIGHLLKEKSGKYAITMFYFLKTDPLNICQVKITGKAVNWGDSKGMRIPCLLQITGNCKMINILPELICKLKKLLFSIK